MTTLIRKIPVALLLLGIASCDQSAALAPLDARLGVQNSTLSIEISNGGPQPVLLDSTPAVINPAGGGNLLLIPVDERGIVHRICASIEYGAQFDEPKKLDPGTSIAIPVIEVDLLKGLYCLADGNYKLTGLYLDKRDHRILTNTIDFEIRSEKVKEQNRD